MNRLITLLIITFLLSYASRAQVSVTATGGTLGPTVYTNFTNAFNAINNGTHTGSITVQVTANFSENSTAALNASGSGSASYTSVLIKPATSVSPVITGTADNTAAIKLNGADNVTIDGSNNGTTSRDMTFQNSNSSGSGAACNIWLASTGTNGATNNVIKNCKILGSSYSLGAPYMGVCIHSSSGTLTGYWLASAVTTGANSNNLVQNNLLNSANAAIVFNGGAGIGETGNQIIGNTIGDITSVTNRKFTNAGIFLLNQANFTISQNTFPWINGSNANQMPGAISIGAGCTGGNITLNKISGVRFTATSSSGGIVLNSSANSNIGVYNNFISDLASNGSATVANNAYGIAILAGSSYNLAYNSVNMNTDPTTTATGYQAALYLGSGATGLNIRNNLFVHSGTNTTNKFSVYSVNTNPASSVIDYNDYYTTASVLGYAGSNQTALTNVQTNLQGGLNHSKNVLPIFVSPTDLHLVAGNASNLANLSGAGTAITGVNIDIDGTVRPALPTMGAHELAAPLCATPTSPSVTTITPTSAVLNWTQTSTPPQWQIKYGAPGFNPATAGTSIFTAIKPYTLNPPLAPSTSYDYYVRAVCGAGDTSAWSVVTNFTTTCNTPSVVSKTDSSRCSTGSVYLQATTTTGASIKWYANATGGTALATGNTFITPSLAVTTTYYAAAVSGNCESTPRTPVIATINPNPVATITPSGTINICAGTTTTLTAGGGGTYQWYDAAGNITGATTGTYTTGNAGTLYVIATVATGCKDTSEVVTVNVNPLPNVFIGNDTSFCSGNTLTLDAGSAGLYLWDNATTNQTRNVTATGIYYVKVTDSNNCSKNDTINVTVNPTPVVNLGNDTALCYGNTLTLNAGNPGASYLWNTGSTTQTIPVNTTGNYSVAVTNIYPCTGSDNINVLVKDLPGGTISAVHGNPATYTFKILNPQFISNYTWNFGDGSPTVVGPLVQHTYANNGIYTVTVSLEGECNDNASRSITVDVYDASGTGIRQIENNKDLVLYPNPAKDLVTIENKKDVHMKHVTLYNVIGQMISTTVADNPDKHKLNISGLAPGLYTIQIETDKGFVIRKFEVMR